MAKLMRGWNLNTEQIVPFSVVVIEKQPWIAAELQRITKKDEYLDEHAQIFFFDSIQQWQQSNSQTQPGKEGKKLASNTLVFLDIEAGAAAALKFIANDFDFLQLSAQKQIVAIVDRTLESLEWRLREAGCLTVLAKPVPSEALVQIITRFQTDLNK